MNYDPQNLDELMEVIKVRIVRGRDRGTTIQNVQETVTNYIKKFLPEAASSDQKVVEKAKPNKKKLPAHITQIKANHQRPDTPTRVLSERESASYDAHFGRDKS